jgi:CHASE1-domain containing sensor protein
MVTTWLKQWWGVPAGIVALCVGLTFAAAALHNQRRVDQVRLDSRASAYAQAIAAAEKDWWAGHGAYTANLADLAQTQRGSGIVAGFRDGLHADVMVSQSRQVALVRVAGRHVFSDRLHDGR